MQVRKLFLFILVAMMAIFIATVTNCTCGDDDDDSGGEEMDDDTEGDDDTTDDDTGDDDTEGDDDDDDDDDTGPDVPDQATLDLSFVYTDANPDIDPFRKIISFDINFLDGEIVEDGTTDCFVNADLPDGELLAEGDEIYYIHPTSGNSLSIYTDTWWEGGYEKHRIEFRWNGQLNTEWMPTPCGGWGVWSYDGLFYSDTGPGDDDDNGLDF